MTGTNEQLHPLDEQLLTELEDSVANPPTPEEQLRLDRIFDKGMAVQMGEREKCEDFWKRYADCLRDIVATENKYVAIVVRATNDHLTAKLDLKTLIRVGVETYCGLEAATELDDEMIEAAHLGAERHFLTT